MAVKKKVKVGEIRRFEVVYDKAVKLWVFWEIGERPYGGKPKRVNFWNFFDSNKGRVVEVARTKCHTWSRKNECRLVIKTKAGRPEQKASHRYPKR